MKYYKCIALLAALLTPLLLCGCSSIYSNYRDLEQLQIIQTLGIDLGEDGGVLLSVASGADVNGGEPTVLSIEAASVETAMEKLQEYSARTSLYFAHAQFLLIGEDAARAGIGEALDYIRRIPLLRSDVRLFLVRGARAETLITGSGNGKYDISDELLSLLREKEHQNGMQVFTCTDISRRLAESGAALISAIDAADTQGVIFSGGGGLAALAAGYGVLRGDALAGFMSGEDALGVSLLDGTVIGGPVALTLPDGSSVTVQLRSGKTKLSPVWDADGSLLCVRAQAQLSAEVAEMSQPESDSSGTLDEISRALSARAENWLDSVLAISVQLDADCLALGERLRLADARRFDAIPRPWRETLGALRFETEVSAELSGGFESKGPVDTQGRGLGGTA